MRREEDDDLDDPEGVPDDNSLGSAIAIGISFGVVAGILIDNLALGIAFGPIIGVLLHTITRQKAE